MHDPVTPASPQPGNQDERVCECGHGRHDHSNGSLWCIHGKTTFPTAYPCDCHAFREYLDGPPPQDRA